MENGSQIPKTRKELAIKYGVSVKTLNKWLERAELTFSNCSFTPKEVSIIYGKLGHPEGEETLEDGFGIDNPEEAD